jgi:predicted SnoaL-like aldol condensation-catalyzing enzyme
MRLSNKEKARAYHQAVSEYDVATVKAMLCPNYIQHNPRVPTGRQAFLGLLPTLKRQQTKIENLHILQDGDFVAMHHLWTKAWPLGAEAMRGFHVIRFDKKGLIAEHWSVLEPATQADSSSRVLGRVHKTLAEGNLRLTIGEGLFDGKEAAIYELSRIVDGRPCERWTLAQQIPNENPANDNTMFGF